MLQVIQHQEHVLLPQVGNQPGAGERLDAFLRENLPGNGAPDQAWLTDRSKIDEARAIPVAPALAGCRFQGQPRLANTAHPAERQQPRVRFGEELADLREFLLPPNEGCEQSALPQVQRWPDVAMLGSVQELRPLIAGEGQRVCQQPGRFSVGPPDRAALQVADAALADPRPLGQLTLGQPNPEPQVLEQFGERRARSGSHDPAPIQRRPARCCPARMWEECGQA